VVGIPVRVFGGVGLCSTCRDSTEGVETYVVVEEVSHERPYGGADDGSMFSQRNLTTRAVRSAQAKHISLAPQHEDATEHDYTPRATELMERDPP
jgi:hypothetical protein